MRSLLLNSAVPDATAVKVVCRFSSVIPLHKMFSHHIKEKSLSEPKDTEGTYNITVGNFYFPVKFHIWTRFKERNYGCS